jgi:hypothetical protein
MQIRIHRKSDQRSTVCHIFETYLKSADYSARPSVPVTSAKKRPPPAFGSTSFSPISLSCLGEVGSCPQTLRDFPINPCKHIGGRDRCRDAVQYTVTLCCVKSPVGIHGFSRSVQSKNESQVLYQACQAILGGRLAIPLKNTILGLVNRPRPTEERLSRVRQASN